MRRDPSRSAGGHGALGMLGGAFDPVHVGHLRPAFEVLEDCGLDRLLLVPCGLPPHRAPPVAPAALRVRMLRAATAAEPRFVVDERETRRDGYSYTVDTLLSLRAEQGERPLCLLLGADAFLGLESWHRWREIPDLAHVIVMRRPGWPLEPQGELAQLLATRRSDDVADLHRRAAGVIRVHPVTALAISSSAVRALLAVGGDPRFLVPDPVRELLATNGCYRTSATSDPPDNPAAARAASMEVSLRAK